MADVEPQRLSTKRRFVQDGVFYAELNEFLRNEMMPEHDMWAQEFKSESRGYAGVHVHRDLTCTHITIRTTRMDDVIGQDGRGVNELQGLIQQRFGFSEGQVKLAIEKVVKRGLAAEVQAENVRTRLLEGLPARRAIMGVLRNVIEEGARGCEVVVTGKLRGGRAKAMKFRQGYMIKTGHARNLYVRSATRHVMMRQGVLGVKVKIMLDRDLTGVDGPVEPLPDIVEIVDPDAPKAKPVAKSGGAGFRRERRDRDDRAPARSAAQDAQAAAAAAQAAAAAAGVPAEGAAAPAGEIGGQ